MEGEAGSYRFPQLEISGADPDRLIKSLTVQFTTAVDASDAIELPGDSRFAPNTGNKAVNRTLNCAAGATAGEWQGYLRDNLKVRLASAVQVRGLRIVAGCQTETDTYDYNSENGHYYRAVKTKARWADALRLAESAPVYMGMHPYLVTITSQQEHNFVYSLINMNAWMGGTDDGVYTSLYNDGKPTIEDNAHFKFFWVSGPEKGTLITEGELGENDSYESPGYSNWADGEPNCWDNNEFYLHFFAEQEGKWNDYPNNVGFELTPEVSVGYVIEYGGMPEDDAQGVDEEWAKADVRIDPSGSTLSSTVNDVPVGTPVGVVESVNGDEDVRTRLPGGGDRPADIERTFYAKDPDAPGGWRELSPDELPGGSPAHAGEYKVVSEAVKEVLDDGTEVPYVPAESVFTVTPKKVDASSLFAGQPLEKVYDGEASIDAAGLAPDLSFALPGADVQVAFGGTATLDDLSVAASKATVTGVRLIGADAGDYRIEGLDDGALEVPAKVLPRELTVRAIPSVVWGRTGLPLTDASGAAIAYRSDLAVYSGSGEWLPNMLAPRDGRVEGGAVVSILGDERFDCSCGGRALDADSPKAGLYKLTLAYSAVHGPAKGRAAGGAAAGGEGAGAATRSAATDGAVIAPRDAVFDAITPSLIGGGRWDIGNYVLELVDGAVAVADDPAARPSGGKEPSPDLPRLPGFLEAAASEVASPEKPPLSPADIEKIVSEKSGAKGPATSVAIFRDGEEADAIDRTVPGTWTVVATYPDPDGGQDIAVRLTYTLTEPSVVVADDEVEVPYDPDGAPKGPDDIAREVGDEYGDRLPEGVEPEVRIERDGEPVVAVDPSVPGEYVVTLTYHDPDGGPDKIVRRVYRVLAPAADGPDNGGAAAKSPGALPRTGDPSAPLAAGLAGLSAAALAAIAASVRSRRRG